MFIHFPTDPRCEVCKVTKTTRTRYKHRSPKRAYGVSLATPLGYLFTADHQKLELRIRVKKMMIETLSSCKMESRIGYGATRSKDVRRLMPPFQNPGIVFKDISKESTKACQELQWTHDKNTSHRSENTGIVE